VPPGGGVDSGIPLPAGVRASSRPQCSQNFESSGIFARVSARWASPRRNDAVAALRRTCSGLVAPAITLDTDVLADIDIDAANICFDNLRFVANFLDIAAAIDVNADGFTCKNCEFVDTSASLNAKIWILGAAAGASDRMIVEGCEFYAFGTANTAAISLPGTPDRCVIRDNIFVGDWGTAAILAAGICTNLSVLRNLVSNLDAGNDVCINIADTSTGIVAYNGVGGRETDNTTDQITGGSTMVLVQNYAVDEGDRSGVLDPAAT